MFPKFFKHKMKEVGSFLRIMKGKTTSQDSERIKGAKEALANVEEEKKLYENELDEAYKGIDPDTKRYQSDPEDRDISAI